MRYVYGVYLEDTTLSAYFALMRLFSEPGYFRSPHITLRGPYTRTLTKEKKARWSTWIQFAYIGQPGEFFFENQNTVYLTCNLIPESKILYKPDYPDSIPHLTLFDGKERKFACELYHLLTKYNWGYTVRVSKISRIGRKQDFHEYFAFMFDDTIALLQQMFPEFGSFSEIEGTAIERRLECIERLCESLHRDYNGSNRLAK